MAFLCLFSLVKFFFQVDFLVSIQSDWPQYGIHRHKVVLILALFPPQCHFSSPSPTLFLLPPFLPLLLPPMFIICSSPGGNQLLHSLAIVNKAVVNIDKPESPVELRVLLVILLWTIEPTRRVWSHLTCPGPGEIGRTVEQLSPSSWVTTIIHLWQCTNTAFTLNRIRVHSGAKHSDHSPGTEIWVDDLLTS